MKARLGVLVACFVLRRRICFDEAWHFVIFTLVIVTLVSFMLVIPTLVIPTLVILKRAMLSEGPYDGGAVRVLQRGSTSMRAVGTGPVDSIELSTVVGFLNPAALDFRMTERLGAAFYGFYRMAFAANGKGAKLYNVLRNVTHNVTYNVITETRVPRELKTSELESFPAREWSEISPRLSDNIRGSLERVLETQTGGVLSPDESYALANCEGDDLIGLLVAANMLRAELAGNIVTYVVNRNINFTNVCFVGCKFCAFSRGPREADSYFHSLDTMARKAREAWDLGATEVCVQGGLPHGLPKFYYRDILRAIKGAVPQMHIHAFSPMEIVYGVELTGMPLTDYLSMLRDNGLGTLPGTAAEILDDEIRHILSANKLSTAQWIEVIRTAHGCGIRSTSTLMYGHCETPAHWVRQMRLLREIQDETGGFTEFVPLGFVHQNTLLFAQGLARSGPTLAEHLKVHALARLLLAGSIHNIQVSWVKLNRKLSQLCLHAGANDYGGTLMEENISREAGATAGQYTSPEDFQSLILEIGRIPAERSTTYSRIHIKLPLNENEFSAEQLPEGAFA